MEPGRDRIIEIGAVKFRGNRVLDRFETFVRPDRNISLSIQSLTGISNDVLVDAPHISTVGRQLKRFLGNAPIVGQSVWMDLAMLEAAGVPLSNRHYDTFELATTLLPDLPTYDLRTIATALEVDISGRHRAVADAEVTMEVFNRLVDRIDEFDDATLSRMADLMKRSKSGLTGIFRAMHRERAGQSSLDLGSTIGAQLLAQLGSGNDGPEAAFLIPRDRPQRLETTGSTAEIEPELIDGALSASGPFAETMPGFEQRDQQIDMAQRVAEALGKQGQLIIEAGTGTGKSIGYLLPAALLAIERGEPVVISTATIALQDQLLNKDIPALVAAGNAAPSSGPGSELRVLRKLRASVLKGRANYLCLRRWILAQREGVQSPAEAQLHAKVTAWLQYTETGDRAELRLTPDEQASWGRLAEEEGACLPNRCIFRQRNQCFLFRARHEAESAHLIVVNHALLLSDLLRGGSVLPTFKNLVIDEAHHLESEVTRQAGFTVSQGGIDNLLRRVFDPEDPTGGTLPLVARMVSTIKGAEAIELASSVADAAQRGQELISSIRSQSQVLFGALGEITGRDASNNGYERRTRITSGLRSSPEWTEIEIRVDDLAAPINELVGVIRDVSRAVADLDADELTTRDETVTELDLLEGELIELRERLLGTLTQQASDVICWLTQHRSTGDVAIHAAPLHISDLLEDELYRKLDSLVLTSATLAADGSFNFIRERLGLPDADAVQVHSPFDYGESTLVAVADDIPEPNKPGHQKHIQQALIELCSASQGRALVLFTSHNALQTSYQAIRRPLEERGIVVLGQRIDGSPRQLLERMTEQEQVVILGTSSFWEGVDIVGEALSLLVITRLPFSVPSDPIFAARSELFDEPFMDYAVPQAILRFKQGFGRLIRSSTDRGVVAVLDRRVVSRRYGQSFIDSLPDAQVEVAPLSRLSEMVTDWLDKTTSG